jgi:hypothetical protein
MNIEPRNQMALILHRAAGNPATTLPNTAISNCFPGLEYDFKQFWRRAFVGIVLEEWDNYVVSAEDPQYAGLERHRLLRVDGRDVLATVPIAVPTDANQIIEVELTVRKMLENSVTPSLETMKPGELTQGLCSPWQHDYRECACYYWPATRPDYVNVEPGPDGVSRGDNWMSKERTGEYVLDDRVDGRMISYVDLFKEWEKLLKFQIKGRDAQEG